MHAAQTTHPDSQENTDRHQLQDQESSYGNFMNAFVFDKLMLFEAADCSGNGQHFYEGVQVGLWNSVRFEILKLVLHVAGMVIHDKFWLKCKRRPLVFCNAI
jgi:hypothetical protein